jgi:DUF971 family protein
MRYGVQIVFSDAHERGIYPWAYLRTLGAAPGAWALITPPPWQPDRPRTTS